MASHVSHGVTQAAADRPVHTQARAARRQGGSGYAAMSNSLLRKALAERG